MKNHLIIGLGGTGGKIIREFRKSIFREYNDINPNDVGVGYIYLDSDNRMMNDDDPDWKILGRSVQLGKDSRVYISSAKLVDYLDNIDNYPWIKPWIGNKKFWNDILNSIQDDAAGGQKRRLGRFLFASNPNEFIHALKKQKSKLTEKSQESDVTFHICAGLAGGTGSGTIIDVISQIRQRYTPKDNIKYKILLYVLLPDVDPPSNWDTGNYHANGYAAFVELNSLSVGHFKPYDITGQGNRVNAFEPFNGCYLFTNQNERGIQIDVEETVPQVMAEFLYEKIVSTNNIAWHSLDRQENAENGDNTPESGERSKRFLTFGLKKLAIPEIEIREYLTFNYAQQACNQMLYNNWNDESGYLGEGKNTDFNEIVQQKETLLNWKMTDEHLILSNGILESDVKNKKWTPINVYWATIMPSIKKTIKEDTKNGRDWLDELTKICVDHFENRYRGLGVKNFYSAKEDAKADIANEIITEIQSRLFDDFKTGTKSLYEIHKILESFIKYSRERYTGFGAIKDKLIQEEQQVEERLDRIKEIWQKTKILFIKRNKLFDRYTFLCQKLYTLRTKIEGYAFASLLMNTVTNKLDHLVSDIQKCISIFNNAAEDLDDNIANRVLDRSTPDFKNQLVKFYEPDKVKRTVKELITDQSEQRKQTNGVRTSILSSFYNDPSFAKFSERMISSNLLDMLQTKCDQNAEIAHSNLIISKDDKILGMSIIEKLMIRYHNSDNELRKYITNLVDYAGVYVHFDSQEVNMSGPGVPDADTCVSYFTVILPRANERYNEFVDKLKTIFTESTTLSVDFIESDIKPNEITLISITNLFPLRFVSQVKMLRDKYKLRLNKDESDKARLHLHLEEDGTQHPPLYLKSVNEVEKEKRRYKEKSIIYVLMAKALGMIEEATNIETGEKTISVIVTKESGLEDDPIALGSDFLKANERISNEGIYTKLMNSVKRAINRDYVHIDSKNKLKKEIISIVKSVKEERGGSSQDIIYRRFNNAANEIIEKILKIK
ncbi:MAG: tubulin-like doman-containing protein [Candidatus Marinimicrobia bacterium]|nr:tubulin-like doman-containing protein [Candidatus Neomarinimicrobiota bacterium]